MNKFKEWLMNDPAGEFVRIVSSTRSRSDLSDDNRKLLEQLFQEYVDDLVSPEQKPYYQSILDEVGNHA